MKTAEGSTKITYQVKCPNCGETTYSHIDRELWSRCLEFSEGKPYGEITCPDCGELFEMSIGDEIL